MNRLIAFLIILLLSCRTAEQPVRSANVKIVVDDTSAALQSISNAAEGNGGYVTESRLWRDGELLRATLTLHVPADKLTSTLAQIRGVAKRIDSETISSGYKCAYEAR